MVCGRATAFEFISSMIAVSFSILILVYGLLQNCYAFQVKVSYHPNPLLSIDRDTARSKLSCRKSKLALYSSSRSTDINNVRISIEYCSGCQWMLRSSWIASEILTTFSHESKLESVNLIPQSPPLSPGGVFRVTSEDISSLELVLWDRSVEGRFPEAKEVKQAVRDVVNPDKDLGHSEKNDASKHAMNLDCLECKTKEEENDAKEDPATSAENQLLLPPAFYDSNTVSIEYSTGSSISSPENKLHTAIHFANELLSMVYERNAWWKENKHLQNDVLKNATVPASVDIVTLIPIRDNIGVLNVKLNGITIFDHNQLLENYGSKSNIREVLSETLSDGGPNDKSRFAIEIMSDDEADEARKFFGVF